MNAGIGLGAISFTCSDRFMAAIGLEESACLEANKRRNKGVSEENN